MRQFVPSDYVDKEGNVYETVGENIREGKNGAVASDFPTPEEIGVDSFIGSDGVNYTPKGAGLANTDNLVDTSYVLRYSNKKLSYEYPIGLLKDNTNNSTPPESKATVDYIKTKTVIPTGFKKYAVSFNVNAGNITLNNIDSIPNLEVKLIEDHFVVKSSLNISFIEITDFTPLAPEVVILDTQIYYDETKLSARININKDGNYSLLLIAG